MTLSIKRWKLDGAELRCSARGFSDLPTESGVELTKASIVSDEACEEVSSSLPRMRVIKVNFENIFMVCSWVWEA